ncbi:MAG: alpha/beta hydrolase [Dehalococcoidia bacterium]
MPYLVTPDEIPLYYEDEGPRTSSAIFLIHGEPFNTKFWQKNIPELAREFRVVSMDVRGRGESGKTDDGQTLAQYARDFRFMLEALALERVVAVGWSMGSAIIWSYVQQFGEDRMVGFVDVDQRPHRFISYDDLLRRLETIRTSRLSNHRKVIVDYYGPEAEIDDELVDWMAYECMKTPTSAHRAAAYESYFADFRPVLPTMKVPARIFWTRYGVVKEDTAKLLNEGIRNSKLVFFEHSGHLLPWTETEKFNREMLSFAREVL